MKALLDAFWRAAAYCLNPRVIVMSLAPLLVILLLSGALFYLYWDASIAAMRQLLESWGWLTSVWAWIGRTGAGDVTAFLAPLLVVVMITPLVVLLSLAVVAAMLSPALTRMVGRRRFPDLEHKKGASLAGSVLRSILVTLVAIVAIVLSMPLWLVPPLVLVLPPLIWGWLTYRVMSFDALAEHASAEERTTLLRQHRMRLLGIGIVCGYLGTAPSIVWASGLFFAAAFFVLVPLAIWIYTLVFAFSALWFGHYCLDALAQLRSQRAVATIAELAHGAALPPPRMQIAERLEK